MGFGWSKKESKEEKASGKLPILDGFDWIKKGDDLVNSGKHKEAIKCYDKAIEMDPKNAHAWQNKGKVLSSTTSARGLFINNQDRYDAIDCFKKVIELDLNYAANAWLCIAEVLAELNIKKNSNDIIMCCDAALDNQIPSQFFHSETGESFPLHLYTYLLKARVFFALEKYKETFEYCDKVLEKIPKEKGIWEVKAHAAGKLKKHEEALKCYEKILELDPENYGAQYEAKKEREYISKH